jgi:hypothetical protein
MKTAKMRISATFGHLNHIERECNLNSQDVKSLLKGYVPFHVICMLQEVAKEKIRYELEEAEKANKIKKSNQILIDSGLKMFGLFSMKDKARKNPKSMLFLSKNLQDADREHGNISSYGLISGEIAEWKGKVPDYIMRVI